ncbi:MAG: bacteriohemerythrin [Methylomonas sp.]|nr:bacteriohemerythrin [Methylomonas sp.]
MTEPTAKIESTDIFPWNENFETGIEEIDHQHRKLVDLVNLLANHLAFQADLPTLNAIFSELAAYAVYHFQTEEAIWVEFCPDDSATAGHRLVHQDFIEAVNRLKSEQNERSFEQIVEDILAFLTQWLAFHILDSDKRMAFIVQGIQAGLSLDEAKHRAEQDMGGAMQVLIQTILAMYESLSSRTINLMKEINERQKLEKKLRLAANVIENTLDAICVTDADLNIVEINPAFRQATACSSESAAGKNMKSFKSGLNDSRLIALIWQTIAQQGHWSGEVKSRNPLGELESEWLTISSMTGEDDTVSNYVAVFSNVSQLLKRQQSLEQAASHDTLTGLPNRLLLMDRMALAIAHAERSGLLFAVCYLDLDGFKPINDTYGHAAGDKLLCELAARYQNVLRNNDTVARLGGDEFVILLEALHSQEDCNVMLTRLLHEISRPFAMAGNEVKVSASIGIALFPKHAVSADDLLLLADQAMYQAKRIGRARFCFARS